MASQDLEPLPWHLSDLNNTFHNHGLLLLLILIVVSLLLLTTFLYFYYNFFSRHGRFSSTNTANFSSAQPNSAILPVVQPPGLDSSAIKCLPILLHRSLAASNRAANVETNVECSICLGLFEDEEVIKVLPKCQHAFHLECVDEWLRAHSSCPLCRENLRAS